MMTDPERKQLLLQRIDKLRFFAQEFGGAPNHPLVMLSLYLVLEVDCKPHVALYRYARYLFIEWLASKRNAVHFWVRHFWLRYCLRMSAEEVIALYERELADISEFLK